MAYLRSFDFVFILHLMVDVLAITNELSVALQREEQEIVNAMHLVETCKLRLQAMRDNEWDELLEKVHQFCYSCDIDVVEMNDNYLQELNDRFDEVNTELLRCVSCLSPKDEFRAFNLSKIVEMANFYPYDFDAVLVRVLSGELKNYIVDVRCHDAFARLKGLGDLARVMVETRKNIIYPHVYLLIKLALILPVATATVERAFSAMKYIKTKSRNRMSDTYLNDCLMTYIERDICESISIESIMHRFQNTKSRRGHYV
ncbi:uncharacterized protein LOC141627512 [Silene latifolia]|uniref:uncharacterized protein LOC141627512 n=1 Tax=Silene latifolia TaxID=37657 RepID=UPI003D76D126